MRCAVFGCSSDNQSKKNPCKAIKFFTFPTTNEELCTIWKDTTGREDEFNLKTSRICSKHFKETDYLDNLKHRLLNYCPSSYRGLKKDAVPTLNLPHDSKTKTVNIGSAERFRKKQQRKVVNDLLNEVGSSHNDSNGNSEDAVPDVNMYVEVETTKDNVDIGIQTDMTKSEISRLKKIIQKQEKIIDEKNKELRKLQKTLSSVKIGIKVRKKKECGNPPKYQMLG